jgi:hypothetical protein
LSARPTPRTEASFLSSYRRHVMDQHGKLEPPDFDRRRRVPMTASGERLYAFTHGTFLEYFAEVHAVAPRALLPLRRAVPV